MSIGIADQIKCTRREISMRERVYARWVSSGKMRQENADLEIAVMKSVLETLRKIEAEGRLI